MTIEQLVHMAIDKDKKCIDDRKYLIAWVWAYQDVNGFADESFEIFKRKFSDYYFKLLLTHADPDSIIRAKEKYLEKHPMLKETAKDTERLKLGFE